MTSVTCSPPATRGRRHFTSPVRHATTAFQQRSMTTPTRRKVEKKIRCNHTPERGRIERPGTNARSDFPYERPLERPNNFDFSAMMDGGWTVEDSLNSVSESALGRNYVGWRVINEIGRGASSTVFRAINMKTGEYAAMKCIKLRRCTNKQKVREEMELLKKLKHQNIVTYLDSHAFDDEFCIFMELVSGGSLSHILKRGPLRENVVRRFTRQICSGLDYLHIRNVIHRDVKSANVLVGNQGVCKLADFGSSIQAPFGADSSALCKSLQGTPLYLAPEIAYNKPYGKPSDIYSLGCTIYEMLRGAPPFAERMSNRDPCFPIICAVHLRAEPINFTHFTPSQKEFLEHFLQRDPEKRSRIEEIIENPFLQNSADVCSFTVDYDSEGEFSENDSEPASLNPLLTLTLLLLGLVVGGVMAVFILKHQSSEREENYFDPASF